MTRFCRTLAKEPLLRAVFEISVGLSVHCLCIYWTLKYTTKCVLAYFTTIVFYAFWLSGLHLKKKILHEIVVKLAIK